MTTAADLASGKGDHDENFPVASYFIGPAYRAPVLAFYDFVRLADDVADHETAPADEKLRLLEEMGACLSGDNEASPEGIKLRQILSLKHLSARHAFDLLVAFKLDVTKTRYADWDDLIAYCRYSAMPVGRYVLDVHGESPDLWPANDALCAALQVINHLQDCAKDYRKIDRVYLPQDILAAHGASVDMLAEDHAPAPLLAAIREVAQKNAELLKTSARFGRAIKNARLALDVEVIQTLAEDLNRKLLRRDPLCEKVHHSKLALTGLCLKAFFRFCCGRIGHSGHRS